MIDTIKALQRKAKVPPKPPSPFLLRVLASDKKLIHLVNTANEKWFLVPNNSARWALLLCAVGGLVAKFKFPKGVRSNQLFKRFVQKVGVRYGWSTQETLRNNIILHLLKLRPMGFTEKEQKELKKYFTKLLLST